jgi:hypothetical protein
VAFKISNILIFSVKGFVTRLHVLWGIFCIMLYTCLIPCMCEDILYYVVQLYTCLIPCMCEDILYYVVHLYDTVYVQGYFVLYDTLVWYHVYARIFCIVLYTCMISCMCEDILYYVLQLYTCVIPCMCEDIVYYVVHLYDIVYVRGYFSL